MLKIGICGYGTVGQSLVDHVLLYNKKIRSNVSSNYTIAKIADRSIDKKEHPKDIEVTKDPMDLPLDSNIDIVIELLGGIDLPYKIITESIRNKKHVITANKALIAEHGDEIFQLAKKNNVYFGFEASVAGAIPIINTLTKNMANENIISLAGIINGTCNYILDQMASNDMPFDDALSSAKELGYAEADPTFDINGMDAAHKISILSSLVYKIKSPLQKTYVQGIEDITSMDIKFASELGYCIKHVGISRKLDESIECMAHPVLIEKDNIFSNVSGVMNALMIRGDRFGASMLYGNGAGGDATASAVTSNLVDAINFATGIDTSSFNISNDSGSENISIKNYDDIESPFYLRIFAEDISGVMAEITKILAKESISIEAVTQHEPADKNLLIPIVMITNSVSFSSIKNSIKKIESLEHVKETVFSIRVLKSDEK
jgi:homoserine dehydrogenase